MDAAAVPPAPCSELDSALDSALAGASRIGVSTPPGRSWSGVARDLREDENAIGGKVHPVAAALPELTVEQIVPAVLAELVARCPPGAGFTRAAIAGSFAARYAALSRGH